MKTVDLRSDTVTRPSPAMREAMAKAEVGDDVFGDDPTINALQDRLAALFGREASLFVASGTMGNQVSLAAHTRPGDEVILEAGAHIFQWEAGAPAVLSGLSVFAVEGKRGVITAEQVAERIRPDDEHYVRTRVVAIENTHNHSGGTIFPLSEMERLRALTKKRGLLLHLDGARLWNAHVATGVAFSTYGSLSDSISVCFSKGLGCPVGSAVIGDHDFVERARRARKRFGGGMRQAGILAAACLYALDHNLKRLADDHANALLLAHALAEVPGVGVDVDTVQTNIVYFDVRNTGRSAQEVVQHLESHGVRTIALGPTRLRLVTHLDVDRPACEFAADVLRKVLTPS
jgi:threonine aldolase